MVKKFIKCSILVLIFASLMPIYFFLPKQGTVSASESNSLQYEVIFDNTDENDLIDLSEHEIEFEIGKDVFTEDGTTIISGSTFKNKTKTRIQYDGSSATLISQTNQVEIQNANKIIFVDNTKTEMLTKQSEVQKEECEFAFEDVAEALGYNIKRVNNKYILTREFFTRRLIVKSNEKIHDETAVKLIKRDDNYIIEYKTEKETKNALNKLQNLKNVEFACVDTVVSADDIQTDYASTQSTYQFHTWGSTVMGVEKYRDELSTYGTLNEVIVAVLDTGIDSDHEMFTDRIVSGGGNFLNGTGVFQRNDYEDVDGHGTHVSGTICELTPNNVKILPLKVLNDDGKGYLSDTAYALEYLSTLNNPNIKVANMSLGGDVSVGNTMHTFMKSYVDLAKSKRIMSVVAAGNDREDVRNHCPANIDSAFTVAAIKDMGYGRYDCAEYSNFGECVDICAPGSNVISAAVGGGVTMKSGTSMATPHVTAAVALLYSNPNKTYTQSLIEEEITLSAYDMGDIGWDAYFGYGVANIQHLYSIVEKNTLSFSSNEYSFQNLFSLELTTSMPNGTIYYTTDGSYPNLDSNVYNNPITITDSSKILAVAYELDLNNKIVKASEVESGQYINENQGIELDFSINSDGLINGYYGLRKTLVIPEIINGVTVKGIAVSAFNAKNIKSVTLPNTATIIGSNAFANCYNLVEIVANGVVEIEDKAFYNCSNLSKVELENVAVIGDEAFLSKSGNNSLTSLNLPNLKIVGKYAFAYCKALSELSANNLTHVANYGFYYSQILEVELPNIECIGNLSFSGNAVVTKLYAPKVEFIGEYVFGDSSTLSEINIENVKYIADNAFESTASLNVDLELPKLETVGYSAFGSSAIKSIIAPNLKKIYKQAFYNSSLERVEIDNVEYIGTLAFDANAKLKLVKLSHCIQYMGDNCFTNSSCSYKIHNNTIAKQYLEEHNFIKYENIAFDNTLLTFEIKNDEISILDVDETLIPEDYKIPALINNLPVVRICRNAFKNCLQIKEIDLPYVRMVEESAFEGCVNLTSVKLNNATSIQARAFKGCSSLSCVQIDEIISVGTEAFLNCESLKSINLQGFEEYIGDCAFGFVKSSNTYLRVEDFEMIVYSGSEGEIYATYNNIEYCLVEIGSIGSYYYKTFTNENGIREAGIAGVFSTIAGEITIPNKLSSQNLTITKIFEGAFEDCSNITKIYIPESVKIIEYTAFMNCVSLEEVYAYGVTEIHEYAFFNCYSLKHLVVPNVESIRARAFTYCYNLETITTQNLKSLGESKRTDSNSGYVFDECYQLKDIYLPRIESIYGLAFYKSLENAYFTNTLKLCDETIFYPTTTVYGYNHHKLINSVDEDNFNLIDENFNVSINSDKNLIKTHKSDTYYLEALSNGYNVLYQWYIKFEGEDFKPIHGEDFYQMLLKDYGRTKYQVKVVAMNWNDEICESSPIEIRMLEDGVDLYFISTECEGFGSIELTQNEVYSGESVGVSILPQEGYKISKVLLNGNEVNVEANFIIRNINEDITIKVEFEKIQFTITILETNNGTIKMVDDSALSNQVEYGSNSKTFIFTPNETYYLKSVIIDGEVADVDIEQVEIYGYTFINVQSNHTISAVFEINSYKITTQTEGLSENKVQETLVQHGSSCDIELISEWNYKIKEIKIDGEPISLDNILNNKLTVSNVVRDVNIVVIYELYCFEITFNDYQNGLVEIEYLNSFSNQTQEFKLKFKPNEGYKLNKLLIDGINITSELSNNEVNIIVSKSVKAVAEFAKIRLTVTIIQPENGRISSNNSTSNHEVEYGTDSLIYKFTANEGYYLESILIDNNVIEVDIKQVEEQGFVLKDVKENHSISAVYKIKHYNISTEIEGEGEISLSDEIINHGGSVVVNIITLNNSELISFYINNEKVNELKKQYVLNNIKQDILIKAKFVPKLHMINVVCGGGGTITPSGVFEIKQGENVVFNIIPNEGYRLKEFKINGECVDVENSFTLENVTRRNDVEVTFEKILLTITVVCDENGTATPQGETLVEYGDSKLLQIKPNEGYGVSKITINNVEVQISNTLTLNNITENTVVDVKFEKLFTIKTVGNYGGIITESADLYEGESKEIRIQPNVGYKIKDVLIDGISVGAVSSYMFNNVNSGHILEVYFEQITFTITINLSGKGIVKSNKPLSEIAYGDSCTIQLEGKDNYSLPNSIRVNGKEIEIDNGIIILQNIMKDVELEVEMIKNEKETDDIVIIVIVIISSIIILAGGTTTVVVLIKKKKRAEDDSQDINNPMQTQAGNMENFTPPKSIQPNNINMTNKPNIAMSNKPNVQQQINAPQPKIGVQNQQINPGARPNNISLNSQPQTRVNNANGVARIVPQTKPTNIQTPPANNIQSRTVGTSQIVQKPQTINSQARPMNQPQQRPMVQQQRPMNQSQNMGQRINPIQPGQTRINQPIKSNENINKNNLTGNSNNNPQNK